MKNALKQLNTPVDLNTCTPREGAVHIAKDVIAALTLNKLEARGLYLMPTRGTDDCSVVEAIKNGTCGVCALGGLWVAAVARNFLFPDDNVFDNEMREQLAPFFTNKQLRLIEKEYECHTHHTKYLAYDRKDRMLLIMQNIIDNNGVFVP